MVRRITAACATLAALLFVSLPSAASAATRAPSLHHSDHPTQTFGAATLYGTSSPLPPAAPQARPRSSLTHRDTGTRHAFGRHASRTARLNAPALRPPVPP